MFDDWELVETGCTAAVVRRSPDGRCHAKSATSSAVRDELIAERDKIAWLAGTGIPGPRVLDWIDAPDSSALVTSTVPGVAAHTLTADASARAVPALAEALTHLHALPIETCPFDRSLAISVPAAEANIAAGVVDHHDFDAERVGLSAVALLGQLQDTRPPGEDLVVCHGDACLPNVLVDPGTLHVTGWIDLGRLGVADRHQDLALITRSMSMPGLNPGFGPAAAAALLDAYPVPVDPDHLEFYRLLDEFF